MTSKRQDTNSPTVFDERYAAMVRAGRLTFWIEPFELYNARAWAERRAGVSPNVLSRIIDAMEYNVGRPDRKAIRVHVDEISPHGPKGG